MAALVPWMLLSVCMLKTALAFHLPLNINISTKTENKFLGTGGKFAVLLRGQSFRSGKGNCDFAVRDLQLNATQSFTKMVLEPLEGHGNKVDIVVTDSDPCELTPQMVQILGLDRVVGVKHFNAANQGVSFQTSLHALEDVLGGPEQLEKYDHILIARHDLTWHGEDLYQWPSAFSQFLFADRCPDEQRADPHFGEQCVSDLFHMMPGHLYKTFSQVVFAKNTSCFDDCIDLEDVEARHLCHREGHDCRPAVEAALQAVGEKSSLAFGDGSERHLNNYVSLVPLGETPDDAPLAADAPPVNIRRVMKAERNSEVQDTFGCCFNWPDSQCCSDTMEALLTKNAPTIKDSAQVLFDKSSDKVSLAPAF